MCSKHSQYIEPCCLSPFSSISPSSMKILACRMTRSNLSGYCKQSRWFLHLLCLTYAETDRSFYMYLWKICRFWPMHQHGRGDTMGCLWAQCDDYCFLWGHLYTKTVIFQKPILEEMGYSLCLLSLWLYSSPCVGQHTYAKLNDYINLYQEGRISNK